MNIRNKLLAGGGALALLAVLVSAGVVGQSAYVAARDSLTAESQARLVAVRENKRSQIEDYLTNLVSGVQALARSSATIDAYKGMRLASRIMVNETGGDANLPTYKAALGDYYTKEFAAEFAKRNTDKPADMAAILNQMDPISLAMQYHYITANPKPVGKKEEMMASPDPSSYSKFHAAAHPTFEAVQKKFGYYDVFLFDPEASRVVYTVFKELDFSSNINSGIAAKTKLAESLTRAAQFKSRDDVAFSDYAQYLASYNDDAAFIAVGIFDGDKNIGVLAVQVPIELITATMTSKKRWKETGLGTTGEAYLVGPDKLLRSDSRFILESKAPFLESIKALYPANIIASMNRKNSAIGYLKVDSEGVRDGLGGATGIKQYKDYRNEEVVGAFVPLRIFGLTWAVIAEADAAEVFAPVDDLARRLLLITALVALVMLALIGGVIVWYVRRFMLPINQLQGAVQKIAGGDMAARAKVTSGDEMETLGNAFDNLLDDRIAALAKAEKENEQLNDSVIGVLQSVSQIAQRDLTVRAPVTEDVMGTVADSINQLTTETGLVLGRVTRIANLVGGASDQVTAQSLIVSNTASEERGNVARMLTQLDGAVTAMGSVAELASVSNRTAAEVSKTTQTALGTVQNSVRGMDAIREAIGEMEKRIKRLGERSQEISQIVGLINTISERTHVLSLNASMQAATAGEAGKGFAVVAEEVQRLAENARQATAQISNLVQNIQIETGDAINSVNRTIDQVVRGSDLAQLSGQQMRDTQEATGRLVALVEKIAASTQEQSRVTADLRQGAQLIDASTKQTSTQLEAQTRVAANLSTASRELIEAVSVFKLPQAA